VSGRARSAARQARPRRPVDVQRGATRGLPRDHLLPRRPGLHGARDLEARAVPRDRHVHGRLRGRALPALRRDGVDGVHRARSHPHGDPGASHLPDDDHRPRTEGFMKKRTMETSLAAHSPKLIRSVERRLFLRQGLSLGALSMLSGCNLTDDESVQKVLEGMSRWNDGAQALIFRPARLAPEFPESAITRPFPFNAFYTEAEVTLVDAKDYKLELAGM